MEIHGMLNLVNSDVTSTAFESTNRFNILIVNSLTETPLSGIDVDTIVFDRETDTYYSNRYGVWLEINLNYVELATGLDSRGNYVFSATNTFTAMVFPGDVGNYIFIDSELFNFGDIGDPQDFVIDFFVDSVKGNGTILYNGVNTGPVDVELNKNLLITTSGSVLVRDPNWLLNGTTTVTHSGDDGYLNVYNPRLKSVTKIIDKYLTHVAIIRSGETTYLAIDGVIEASAPSVEYNHFDPVKIGSGYVGAFNGSIINLRVSKGTDLGWTNGFFNNIPYANPNIPTTTKFLLTDGSTDRSGNFTINKMGSNLVVYNDIFPRQLTSAELANNINISCANHAFRLPDVCYEGMAYQFQATKFILYSGKYPINKNSGIISNKAICHSPNKYHRVVFSKDAWHDVTPNYSNLINPTLSARLLNSRYGYTHAVMPNGNFYDFTSKQSIFNWGSPYLSSDKKGFNKFNIPYLYCYNFSSNQILNSYYSDSVYGGNGYTYEFVFRLEWYFSNLQKLFIGNNTNTYIGFQSGRIVIGFGNGSNTIPVDLVTGHWYHARINVSIVNSNTVNIFHYIRDIDSSNGWSTTYGYSGSGYVIPALKTIVSRCPVDLIFFTSINNSGFGSSNLNNYSQFFTGV